MYPNSEDRDTSAPEPRPALALAAAAMERALTYVAEGRITLATIEAEKIKMKDAFLITADLTVAGKRAPASVAFSDELWGAEVKGYLSTIKGLRRGDISKIVTEARKFSRVTRPHSYNNNDDDDDEAPAHQGAQNSRARIPLNYNDDDDDDDDEEEEGHYDVDGNGSENGETEDRKPGVGIRGGQPSLPPQDYEDEDEDEEEAKVSVSPQRLKRYRDDEEMYEVPAHRTRYMDDDEDANSICYSEGHALEVNENDYEDEEMEVSAHPDHVVLIADHNTALSIRPLKLFYHDHLMFSYFFDATLILLISVMIQLGLSYLDYDTIWTFLPPLFTLLPPPSSLGECTSISPDTPSTAYAFFLGTAFTQLARLLGSLNPLMFLFHTNTHLLLAGLGV